MLEKIEIENFRNIKNLSFEPKRINLILGPNNVGKTTLLEAILVSLIGLQEEDIISRYRLSRKSVWERLFFLRSKYKSREYNLFFRERENPFKIRIKIKDVKYEITLENKDQGIFRIAKLGSKDIIRFGSTYPNRGGNILNISYCFLYPGILNEIDLEEVWSELDKYGKTESVKSIVRDHFGIESMEFSPLITEDGRVYVLHYKKGKVKYPIFLLGSGARISIVIALLSIINDIVLFDDFEIALHPDTIEVISNILKDSKAQFFITTQSKEVIKSLVERIEDIQIIYFYRDCSYSIFSRDNAKEILEHTDEIR